MPPAKRSTSTRRKTSTRRSTSARKSSSSTPAALKRLNKSLESAQNALVALRKDVTKDTSAGARNLYKDLEKFVKDAQRSSGRFGTALQKDLDRLQKQVRAAAAGKKTSSARRTSSSAKPRRSSSTAKRSTSRSRSGSGSRSRSRTRSR
jgi:hypothetical protein